MKAVHVLGNRQIAVEDFPDPTPGEGEVLVHVKASGICGSEMGGYRGDRAQAMNSGHECAGEVIDASRASRLKVGDRVGIAAVWGCGECRWCRAGQNTYCDNRRGLGGAHAELVVAPEIWCPKLDDETPYDVGVLLSGDGLGVPYHVSRRSPTVGGMMVAVVGTGPIGLGHCLVQAFLGAEVIALDLSPARLELAQKLGAAHVVNVSEADPIEAVGEITRGMLCDKVIEAAGGPQALKTALRIVGKAGTVVACGEQGAVPISPAEDLIRRDITMMGSWFYQFREQPAMVDLYHRGLRVGDLITHHFPLSEAAQGFRVMDEAKSGKVMLEP